MNNLSTLTPELDQAREQPAAQAGVSPSFQPAPNKNSASPSVDVLSAHFARLWIVGLLLSLGLAGKATHAAEMATFEIVARDGRLYPERLEVPAGVKLKLMLRNEGKTPVEIENLELRVEKVLAPDAAASITIQPLRPGSYSFIDEFHAETGKMLLVAK
jgi:hypothetical protein